MSYLLDTNVCIQLLNNTNYALNDRLRQEEPEDIYLCTVVQMELYYGAYRSLRREQNMGCISILKKAKNLTLFGNGENGNG
ncbi:MAG: type II toxin-antitoxin system VapC family toxin [Cyanobacteriota bacterium]|nr:type II toxin-antitoxin system VapC family toxin [Cyanobacteriota bacterium]